MKWVLIFLPIILFCQESGNIGKTGVLGEASINSVERKDRDFEVYIYSMSASVIQFPAAQFAFEVGINVDGNFGKTSIDQYHISVELGGRYYPMKSFNLFGSILGQFSNTKTGYGYADSNGYGVEMIVGYDHFLRASQFALEPYVGRTYYTFGSDGNVAKQVTNAVGLKLLVLF